MMCFRPRISVAVQCTLDIAANSVLQERFQDALKENTKLTAQLTDAHNEITKLKERLKELEVDMKYLFDVWIGKNVEEPSVCFNLFSDM